MLALVQKHRAQSAVRGAPNTYRPAEQVTGSPLSQGQGEGTPSSSISSICWRCSLESRSAWHPAEPVSEYTCSGSMWTKGQECVNWSLATKEQSDQSWRRNGRWSLAAGFQQTQASTGTPRREPQAQVKNLTLTLNDAGSSPGLLHFPTGAVPFHAVFLRNVPEFPTCHCHWNRWLGGGQHFMSLVFLKRFYHLLFINAWYHAKRKKK